MFAALRKFTDATKKDKTVVKALDVENSGLSPEQIAKGVKGLRLLDMEPRMNNLSRNDAITFFFAMGLNPSEDIIDAKLRHLKIQDAVSFTWGQVAHIWFALLQDMSDEEEILRRAFQFFDKDGNGDISIYELKTTMHELGDLLTEEEIMSFMAIMDVNNDGVIGYEEFLGALKTQTLDGPLGTSVLDEVDDEDEELGSSANVSSSLMSVTRGENGAPMGAVEEEGVGDEEDVAAFGACLPTLDAIAVPMGGPGGVAAASPQNSFRASSSHHSGSSVRSASLLNTSPKQQRTGSSAQLSQP